MIRDHPPLRHGNSRVARDPATCHLVQYNCLFIIVTLDYRNDDDVGLEGDGVGALNPLVEFTPHLNWRLTLQALSK